MDTKTQGDKILRIYLFEQNPLFSHLARNPFCLEDRFHAALQIVSLPGWVHFIVKFPFFFLFLGSIVGREHIASIFCALERWDEGWRVKEFGRTDSNNMFVTGAPYTVRPMLSSVLYSCFKASKSLWFLKSQGNGLEDTENVNQIFEIPFGYSLETFLCRSAFRLTKAHFYIHNLTLSKSSLKSPSENMVQ